MTARQITSKIITCLLLLSGLAFAQDPVQITPFQLFTFDGNSGNVKACSGCSIYTYVAGTNSPSPTYTDSTLMTPNTNPVLTNSAGYASNSGTVTGIWVGTTCLKLVAKDANSVTLWTQDNICDQAQILAAMNFVKTSTLASSAGAGMVGFDQSTSYLASTIGTYLQEAKINIKSPPYNAKCDGSTDDTTAINSAIQAVGSSGVPLYIPPGTCIVNTATAGVILNILSSAGMTIKGAGSARSIIKTTTASADLMAAISISFANPVYDLSGFSLIGPDYNGGVSICPTTTGGNGLRISGSASPRVNINDVVVYGFCGSGSAGMWLDNAEDGVISRTESQFNDYGFKLTTAFNGNALNGLLAGQNATIGIDCEQCQSDTFNSPVIQSNKKTGLMLANSNSNVFNACHLENNNTSATPGIFGTSLLGSNGHFVIGNLFNGCVFEGTHETVGLTGASGAAVTSSNLFNGGISSSAPNPFVISNGAFGAATFNGITATTAITDPSFAVTILNDTSTHLNYYPNGSFTGYVTNVQAPTLGPVSFTPTLNFGGSSTGITYSTQTGFYTTTNGVTHATIVMTLTSKGSATGNATITGIPAAPNGGAGTALFFSGASGLTVPVASVPGGGGTSISLLQQAATVDSALTDANFSNTTSLLISVDYN